MSDNNYYSKRCQKWKNAVIEIIRKILKERTVSQINDQGYSVPEAAKSLGIRTNLLYRWKQQIEDQQRGKSLAEDEREELKRLRKEIK